MGRKHNILLSIGLALLGMSAVSCNIEEIDVPELEKKTFDLRVSARPKGFDTIDVGTRSNKTDVEKTVTSMTMFILDNSGNVINRQYIPSSNPLFSIDREDFAGRNVNAARIWVLANYPDNTASQEAEDLDDILALDYVLTDIGMPEDGFPMIGSNDEGALDLRPVSEGGTMASGNIINVTLKCLYAKVVFDISVDPKQVTDNKQKFTMTSCTVHNIPSQVELRAPENETAHVSDILKDENDNSKNKVFAIPQSTWSSDKAVESGSSISFTFYMPEHQVLPETSSDNYTYPWGTGAKYDENGESAPWKVDFRQHYKPLLLGNTKADYATYVELQGTFNDHNDINHIITYKIYLGEDNYGNFFVGRDKQLNNTIRIKGATNSNSVDPNTISYDHRVDISATQFKFSLERETMLDSHWEIRPIRIAINRDEYPNAKVKVQVLEPGTNDWIRLEMPSSPAGSEYCDAGTDQTAREYLAYGKRKYFTTDLLTSTLAANTSYEITPSTPNSTTVRTLSNGDTEYTVWAYIDENHDLTDIPSAGGCTSRNALVRCEFWEDGDESNTASNNYVVQDYNFSQRSLYRINYTDPKTSLTRTYYIEDYEEYLYNYDSKEQYGATTDGMAWGLNGVQLSNVDYAIFCDGIFSDEEATRSVRNQFPNAKYDFYNNYAEAQNGKLAYHPYSGRQFTKKIARNTTVIIPTNVQPTNAVDYCLNRNKRKSGSGEIDMVTFDWYLPSIDEIEDVVMGGYSDFEVFQNKYYWSSQPSYTVDSLKYELWLIVGTPTTYGSFFMDNTSNARATKVEAQGGGYKTVRSGAYGAETMYSFHYQLGYQGPSSTGKTTTLGEGNQPRTNVNRIRCVYKNWTDKVSTFGYESSENEGIWVSNNFGSNANAKHNGNRGGRANGFVQTATVTTNVSICRPGILSFWVKYYDKTSNWTVSVSEDNANWTEVYGPIADTNQWQKIEVDLSAYGDVYVRITTTGQRTGGLLGSYPTRYIDDISLSYKE